MKNILLLSLVILTAAANSPAQVKSSAVLKIDQGNAVVQIRLADDDAPKGQPSVALFSTDKKIEREVPTVARNLINPFKNFDLTFAGYDPNDELLYEVVLLFDAVDQSGAGFKRRLSLPVKPVVNVELARDPTACPKDNNLQMIISAQNSQNFSWQPIQNWLASYLTDNKILANVTVKQKGEADEVYRVTSFVSKGVVGRDLGVCLTLDKDLPPESFDATIEFLGTPPPDVALSVSAKKLDGTFLMNFPKDVEAGDPDKKKLENTIDFGASLTSSVEQEDLPTAATGGIAATVRRRKNKGVFDLGFEYPLLKTEIQANKWMMFLNPFFKATVSTGKIDKDTLSRNRVLFGLAGESRYRQRRTEPDDKSFIATHRILWGVTHASDRDFKQKEIYATAAYSPVWAALNRPYGLNYKTVNGERVQRLFGYTVVPIVGFDFGRTYSRRNPAPAIEPSPVIRRIHFGLNLGLDITSYVSLTAEDTLYTRWEDSENRMKNFFKATGNFKLFRSSRNRLAHGLFVTYEKGQSPPFATPETNSVRIGYRVVGDFCGLYCR